MTFRSLFDAHFALTWSLVEGEDELAREEVVTEVWERAYAIFDRGDVVDEGVLRGLIEGDVEVPREADEELRMRVLNEVILAVSKAERRSLRIPALFVGGGMALAVFAALAIVVVFSIFFD